MANPFAVSGNNNRNAPVAGVPKPGGAPGLTPLTGSLFGAPTATQSSGVQTGLIADLKDPPGASDPSLLGDTFNYSGMDPQAAFMQAVNDLGVTGTKTRAGGLGSVAAWLNNRGLPGWSAQGGPNDDGITYNGNTYDVIHGGDDAWQWLLDNGESGGGGGQVADIPMPNFDLSGMTNPLPETPLSLSTDQALLDLINNKGQSSTDLGKASTQALLDRLAKVGTNQDLAMRIENVRGPLDASRKAQLSQLDADLADRGLLSAPGAISGPDISSRGRVEASLANDYAQGIRGALLDQDTSDLQAIQAATGQSNQEAQNLLAAIGQSTNSQQMKASIALQSLEQNIGWNEFLATYGLNRATVMANIANGNYQTLIDYVHSLTGLAAVGANGASTS